MKKILSALALCLGLSLTTAFALNPSDFIIFVRGDANGDGSLNVTDATMIMSYVYNGGPAPGCLDAADANDDGSVNSADSDLILNYVYSGGNPPAAPFPNCGQDGTADYLTCNVEPSYCDD